MNTNELDIKKIIYVFYRKKWIVFLCLVVFLVPIYWLNKKTVPVYQASTKIVYDQYKGSKSITETYGKASENIVINQIEEIESRSLALDVAMNLPDSILSTFIIPSNREADFNKFQYIVEKINEGISANSITGSDVIEIKVEATSPISAKYIANSITDILIQRNLEIVGKEAINVRSIIDKQLITYKEQLDRAEYNLKLYKEENKVTEVNQQAQEVLRRITEAENLLNQTITSLDAAKERLSNIQGRLEEERKGLVPSVTKTTSLRAQNLRDKLIELQNQYTTLKVQEYSDNHPQMVSLKEQIEETKKNLLEESLKIASGETPIDPLSQIQRFVEESISLEIEIKTLEAQKTALSSVISNYESALNTMPSKELRLAQLMREKAVNEEIYTMLLSKREETKIAQAEIAGNIRIIDYAVLPDNPIKPKKILNLLVGLILGLSSGIGLSLLIEFMDENVKRAEDAERISGIKVIGTIPKIKIKKGVMFFRKLSRMLKRLPKQSSKDLITFQKPQSAEAEAFRTLRTNLNISEFNSGSKVILITSGNPNEGKSFIAANLSVITAQMGLKTLIIDADLRKPVLHFLFDSTPEPGLSNLIKTYKPIKGPTYTGSSSEVEKELKDIIGVPEIFDIADEIQKPGFTFDKNIINRDNGKSYHDYSEEYNLKNTIYPTFVDNLDFLPCGEILTYPAEILGTRAMKNILMELKENYDMIFIDTPPINVVTDAGIISNFVDDVILVLRAGINSQKDILKAKGLLIQAKSKIIGMVVNYVNAQQEGYSNYYSYFSKKMERKSPVKTRKAKIDSHKKIKT
ncbi:AAA family ATPase [candidate division KSB1 bacterium]|nr:AAA family ATPase [candidate division KSB1 bacterium]